MKKMMWKTGSTLITLAAGLLLLSGSARAEGGWGPCNTISGAPYQYTPVIDATITDPQRNSRGQIVRDFYQWNLGQDYQGHCECPPGSNTQDAPEKRPVYFQAISPLPVDHQAGDETYFTINEFLAFSAEVHVAGKINAYMKVPFNDFSNGNETASPHICSSDASFFGTGSKGKLNLYIRRPFVGESVIPPTELLSVKGTMEPGVYSAVPLSVVTISGRVVVPQGCEMPAGYTTEIDFGDYNARDFKNRHGDMPVNARVIEKKLDFKCSNISDGVRIYLKLEANTNPDNPDAIDLGNPDIGAIVTRKTGTVLRPGTDDNVELDVGPLNGVDRDASVTLKAYPISTTGKIPQSGEFDGVATLSLEVE